MKQTCEQCKRPVIVTRTPAGAAVLLDPAPVLIYWLDRADCGTLAQRADDVKYYAPHRCDAPVGSIPPRRVKVEKPAPALRRPRKQGRPLNHRQETYMKNRLAGCSRVVALTRAGYKFASAHVADARGWELDSRLGIGLDSNGVPERNA